MKLIAAAILSYDHDGDSRIRSDKSPRYYSRPRPAAANQGSSCQFVRAAKTADTNMEIFMDKVKADKKLLVAANMGLTDAEGKGFWPIYDMYQTDLKGLNDRMTAAIHSYADAYTKNTLTDAQATKLVNDVLTIDQDEVAMRKKYATSLAAVLPGKESGAIPADRNQDPRRSSHRDG